MKRSKLTAAARLMGRKGGKATTPAKVAASRENGRRGGRPRRVHAGKDKE